MERKYPGRKQTAQPANRDNELGKFGRCEEVEVMQHGLEFYAKANSRGHDDATEGTLSRDSRRVISEYNAYKGRVYFQELSGKPVGNQLIL